MDFRTRYFQEDNMYARMENCSKAETLEETFKALDYMRIRHEGQFRKGSKYATEKVKYINHPLLMACHLHAFGIRNDQLLAATLLHDVVEDTGVTASQLPFSDEVKKIVSLVSFFVPEGMEKHEAKKIYYKNISENGEACMIKLVDRCNNVSTMAGSFKREKLIEYINETEEFVLPLSDVIKNNYPQYADAAFVMKYHIISILETIKYLIVE